MEQKQGRQTNLKDAANYTIHAMATAGMEQTKLYQVQKQG